jgi:20S proteasome subunit beta 3
MGDDIMSYNGGVAVAMKGKECVAIACDKRYGVQNRTIATNFTKIFQYGDHCFVAFCGLATDVSLKMNLEDDFIFASFRFKQSLND